VNVLPVFPTLGQPRQVDVRKLLLAGENEHLELKASFRWEINSQKVSKELEKVVMKSLAGFMNTAGGYLIIGINDEKKIIGLENDFNSLTKHNSDGFENRFGVAFNSYIGKEFRQYVSVSFQKYEGKEICIMKIKPSKKPVYVKDGKTEEFFLRTGNATNPMTMSEANEYIKTHWTVRV
jgi:predicted HTH transcriptional regulator